VSSDQRAGVVVLGSTGSIGVSTLEVVSALSDRFEIVGLAAATNAGVLQEQIDRLRPRFAALVDSTAPIIGTTRVTEDALRFLATLEDADIVVVATTGHAAIVPTLAALEAGKIVALANKEVIVAAGEIVMPVAHRHPGKLRPVDSEHSAIWQCLNASRVDPQQVRRLVLTASGGPFRGWSREQMAAVTPEQALRHPNWAMGTKITIDSATLMNKGLELIEAHWLFSCPLERIEVVVHPQSLVHSCVEYVDGSIVAQIGSHDMRLPIQYALTWPEHLAGPADQISILELTRLDFEPPDLDSFPLLRVAREAAAAGGTYPTVLSVADAIAVESFLRREIPFGAIAVVIEDSLAAHVPAESISLDAIVDAESWTEAFARQVIRERWSAL
jgi:1-deoxy-D-xylulose-5-phosphate reductoisomerase